MKDKDIILIKKNLKNYKEAIQKLEEISRKNEKLDSHATFRPFFFKYYLRFLLDSLKEDSQEYRELKWDYDRITQYLGSIEQKFGKAYHEILYQRLELHMKRFPTIIQYFGDPEDLDFLDETANNLGMLDAIVFLIAELSNDYDLRELKSQLIKFDAEYREKFYNKIEKIVECCPSFEQMSFPDNFWWHHPSKILAEKRAKQRKKSHE